MKSLLALLVVGVVLLPASAFAFTLDAGDEDVPVQSITIATEVEEVGEVEMTGFTLEANGEPVVVESIAITTGENTPVVGDVVILSDVGTLVFPENTGEAVVPGDIQTITFIADMHVGESTAQVSKDVKKYAKLIAKLERLEARLEQLKAKAVLTKKHIDILKENGADTHAKKIAKFEKKLVKVEARIESIPAKIAELKTRVEAFYGGLVVSEGASDLSSSGIIVIGN